MPRSTGPLPLIETSHGRPPERAALVGRHVSLLPVDAARDAQRLYAISHGDGNEALWRYMPYGPFGSPAAMHDWLATCQASHDPLFFTVQATDTGQALGMTGFLNIAPDMLRLELGHIWYSPAAQKTRANTEAVFLMLQHCFDTLHYRRVEWKCDNRNTASKTAAMRLGFSPEGLFRQHMVVKQQNRDTAWFSMLDSEWRLLRVHYESWLEQPTGGTLSLASLNLKTLAALGTC